MRSPTQFFRLAIAATAFAALLPAQLLAQNAAGQTPASRPPAGAPSAGNQSPAQMVIEPRAVELLKASTAKLAAARSLSFTALVGYEYPSKLGPALLYTMRYDVDLQRPDKLRVIVPGDGPASEFYYDGKQVMAYLPANDLVAIADAPPTIEGALKQAYERSATYFPFADWVVSDPYKAIADGMKLAYVVGESAQVGGVRTNMIVVANDAVFLQLWIGVDDQLPRRVRAVYREDPQRLRHEMNLINWKLNGTLPAAAFTSEKAKSARKIEFGNPAAKAAQ
jgi:hypothetical protein